MPEHEYVGPFGYDHNNEFMEWRFRRWKPPYREQLRRIAIAIGIDAGNSREALHQIHTFVPSNGAKGAQLFAPLWLAYAEAAEHYVINTFDCDNYPFHTAPHSPHIHETHCGHHASEPAHNIINLTALIQRFLPASLQTNDNVGAIMNIVAGALNAYRTPNGGSLTYGIQIDQSSFNSP